MASAQLPALSVEESARALLDRHGDRAFVLAVEKANQSRAAGDKRNSKSWADVAWAINDLLGGAPAV